MRTPLAFLLLAAVALPATGHAAPDRYSGGRTTPAVTARLVAYQGPMLSWPNKRLPGPTAEAVAQPSPQTPARIPAYQAQAPRPQQATASPVSALPAGLYAAPQPAPARQQLARAAPPRALPPVAAPQPAQPRSGDTRYYSIHRPFGLTPDAIPTPSGDRYVLIGPAETATAPQTGADATDDDRPF